jgi:hypothetical protein
VILVRPSCRRHRPLLLDLAEHAERGPGTAEALDHMADCRACEQEVMGVVLTAAALRRAGAAYRSLPEPARRPMAPPPAAGGRGRWAWRLQLGSLGTAAVVAALVVAPRVSPPEPPAAEPAVVHSVPAHAPGFKSWRVAEQRLASRSDNGPIAVVVVPVGTLPPRYPDTLFRPWKEVAAPDASARVLEPR